MDTKDEPIRASEKIKLIMMELMQKEPFSDITVKEICESSGYSRQTFYQLYGSKEAVLQEEIRERVHQSQGRMAEIRTLGYFICSYLEENRLLLRILSENGLGHLLHRELSDIMDPLVQRITPEKDRSCREIAGAFLSAALTNAFLRWAQDEKRIPEHQVSSPILQILRGEYFHLNG